MSILSDTKEQWDDQPKSFRIGMIIFVVCGIIFLFWHKDKSAEMTKQEREDKTLAIAKKNALEDPTTTYQVVPTTSRNQGLEEMARELEAIKQELQKAKTPQGVPANPAAPAGEAKRAFGDIQGPQDPLNPGSAKPPQGPLDLNAALRPVSFDAPKQPLKPKKSTALQASATDSLSDLPKPGPSAAPRANYRVWQAEDTAEADSELQKRLKTKRPMLALPENSGIEAIMLTGALAKPTGSLAGRVGTAISANDIGVPFVTRLKGDAILPNGWRVSDLGECFLGGSGVAVLSAQRMYANAKNLTCLAKNGELLDVPVKAYAVDEDGTVGIAGTVVNKQGSILAQAWLTGMIGGFSAAITPTAIPQVNTTSGGGTQTYTTPDPGTVARASLGQGLAKVNEAIAQFYLDFAKQIYPVIEVPSKTRVTWIFAETLEIPAPTTRR
jgi:conjugal transfer pilus assembly protein TraB